MPTLPDKYALGQAPIDNPGRAVVQLPKDALDPSAMAMEVVGAGIRGIAGGIKAKINEADDDEIQKAIVDFDLEQEKRLDDAKRTANPEARDFTANYRGIYDQAAREFMTKVPDRLKPKVDGILVKRGAAFEKRAYDFELAERDRFNVDDVTNRLNEIYNRSTAYPERHEDNSQRGIAIIRGSKLSERAKIKAQRDFLDRNEEYAIRSLAERYAAEGRDVGEIIEQLKKVPKGSWQREPLSPDGTSEDFRNNTGAPASIRYNNPGAMYPGPSSKKFGSIGTEIIGGGHKIAVFPDAVTGAAAQFDLLANSSKYQGRRLSDAIRTWSGGNSPGTYLDVIRRETGLEPDTVLTKELLENPRIAIPLAKAMAVQEAGKPYPLSDAGWQRAHQMAFGGTPPQGTPLGKLPDGQVERTELPPVQGEKPKQKVDPETGEPIPDIGTDKTDLVEPGVLKPITAEAADEPYETDEAPYRNLTPATRRKLINVLRGASRSQLSTQITDDIERVRLGREPNRGPDGRTALERARQILPPVQYRKLQEQWQEAEIEHRTITPLRSLPIEEAQDHILRVMQDAERNEESLRAARKVRDKAERELEKIRKLRETDPVRSVNGFIGEETDDRKPPLPNTAAAMRVIQQSRAPSVVTGPDGTPQPQGPVRSRLTPQQQWELMFDARLKDQELIMPGEPERHRIIDRNEAQKLLRLPKDVKNIDRNRYRQLLGEAAERAEQTYGPKYAKRVMQEAIAFQITGVDEDHKSKQADVLRKMIQGEPITTADIGQIRDLERLRREGLNFGSDALANLDRVGRGIQFPVAPYGDPGRPAIGQTYQPSERQQQWLRDNPEGWATFDEKFGPGTAARILGLPEADTRGQRMKVPKAKPGSPEQRASDAVKPKDKGFFGR